MEINPYRIDTPGIISFSGGRTSGYMLRMILDAFGGQLHAIVRIEDSPAGCEARMKRFLGAVVKTGGESE